MDKKDELLSLVKGYIIMNNYNSFYEHLGDGKINYLPSEDMVCIPINNIGIPAFSC